MSGALSIMLESSQSAAGQCASVVFSPSSGSGQSIYHVNLSTATVGAHIFYRVTSNAGAPPNNPPQHIGDNAVSPTVRIGNSFGAITVVAVADSTTAVTAIAYLPSLLDSAVVEGDYAGPPGHP